MFDGGIQLLFFALRIIIIIVAILTVVFGLLIMIYSQRCRDKTKITIRQLNKYYDELAQSVRKEILTKSAYRAFLRDVKKRKQERHKQSETRRHVFVLHFEGDLKASAVQSLREEVTAILSVAAPEDEVVVVLESSGGLVSAYGLAASQLQRIKDRGLLLTVIVDKIAASGGYLMACVADHVFAAPFAVIGSIGVIAQLPNFHRLLKKHNVDFEQIMGGNYKRTLTLFGENTPEGRQKCQEEVNDIHGLFKDFVKQHRPHVEVEKLATGEHWLGTQAYELSLIDDIITSDDYLLQRNDIADLYEIHCQYKKKIFEIMAEGFSVVVRRLFSIHYDKQTQIRL